MNSSHPGTYGLTGLQPTAFLLGRFCHPGTYGLTGLGS